MHYMSFYKKTPHNKPSHSHDKIFQETLGPEKHLTTKNDAEILDLLIFKYYAFI